MEERDLECYSKQHNIILSCEVTTVPKRTRPHQLEDLSITRLCEIFQRTGWVVYRLAPDYGEDLLVRLFRHGAPTQYAFFVQAKASDNVSHLYSSKDRQFRYPLKKDHLRQWGSLPEPVLVTLWDAKADKTYWQWVHDYLSSDTGLAAMEHSGNLVRFQIPEENVLDHDGLRIIRRYLTQQRIVWNDRLAEIIEGISNFLNESFKIRIEISPHDSESVWVHHPDGDVTLLTFGSLAEECRRCEETSGQSVLSILRAGLNWESQIIECLKQGIPYVDKDASGNVIATYHTVEEMLENDRRRMLTGELEDDLRKILGLPIDSW